MSIDTEWQPKLALSTPPLVTGSEAHRAEQSSAKPAALVTCLAILFVTFTAILVPFSLFVVRVTILAQSAWLSILGLLLVYLFSMGPWPESSFFSRIRLPKRPSIILPMHWWFSTAMLLVAVSLLLAFYYLARYFSGWQILALALWFEVSYYMIYRFMARFTAFIGLDGFGESSFSCARAYAKVAQVCLDGQENDKAFRYLRNALAMTAKVVRLKAFSSKKLADMIAMVDATKELRPLQLSSWEPKILRALGKLPDLEEISILADQFEGDKAHAWIKQLTHTPRNPSFSRYIERTLGVLVAIATLIAVFASDSQRAWLLASLQTAYDPSSILGAISLLFAYYLLIFTIRINGSLPSVSTRLLKKADLIDVS